MAQCCEYSSITNGPLYDHSEPLDGDKMLATNCLSCVLTPPHLTYNAVLTEDDARPRFGVIIGEKVLKDSAI